MRRALTAAAMVAATASVLSLARSGAAAAGESSQTTTTRIGKVRPAYDKGRAGYRMIGGGWRFRYIATTLAVPACSTKATSAEIAFFYEDLDYVALTVKCGGGPGSVTYDVSTIEPAKPLALRPKVGDRVTISMYYKPAAEKLYYSAIDGTTGGKSSAVETTGRWTWDQAEVTGSGPTSLAAKETRLWAFTDTGLTTQNGRRGTILGPWSTVRAIGTTTGTSAGAVVLWPRWPWNKGRNFGIWWRTAK